MMTWKRARSEEQKERRVAAIVTATARLYEKRAFEDISFALIAREAKFTRSNLYKYFRTKEEIFLELLGRDLVQYSRDLVKALGENEACNIAEFACIWTNTLIKHDRMLRLFAILSSPGGTPLYFVNIGGE